MPKSIAPSEARLKDGEHKVLKYAFWGAENPLSTPPTTLGNVLLRKFIYDPAGVPNENRFSERHLNSAMLQLLKAIDTNGDQIISRKEIADITLYVFGYSWGATAAMAMARKLGNFGLLTIWRRGRPIAEYHLEAPVPIEVLALVDPVPVISGMINRFIRLYGFPKLNNHIGTLLNYYQTKGGSGTFRDGCDPHLPMAPYEQIGTPLSRRLKGSSLDLVENAERRTKIEQVNVTIDQKDLSIEGSPIPGAPMMRLRGDEVNHDVIPFFVADFILKHVL